MQNKKKPPTSAHTANTKFGMGDFYGTGSKAKLGTASSYLDKSTIKQKRLTKPPKSLA